MIFRSQNYLKKIININTHAPQPLVIFIISLLLIIIPITSTFAAVKSGSSCSQPGSSAISGKIKFKCIKSGKKLVWSKGVTEKKAPVSSETPAPKSGDSLSFMSSEPSEQITFSNLAKNYAYVPYVAWKKSADKIAKFQPSDVKITVLVGENTDPINKNPSPAVTLVSRMYGDFKQASEFVLIYYSI